GRAVGCRDGGEVRARPLHVEGDLVDRLEATEPLDRRPLHEVLQLEDLPDLDLASELLVRGGPWEPHRPPHRFLGRVDLDDRPAGDLIPGVDERSVHDGPALTGVADPPAFPCRLETHGVVENTGLLELLVVLDDLAKRLLARQDPGLGCVVGLHHDGESHGIASFAVLPLRGTTLARSVWLTPGSEERYSSDPPRSPRNARNSAYVPCEASSGVRSSICGDSADLSYSRIASVGRSSWRTPIPPTRYSVVGPSGCLSGR